MSRFAGGGVGGVCPGLLKCVCMCVQVCRGQEGGGCPHYQGHEEKLEGGLLATVEADNRGKQEGRLSGE